MKFIDDDYPNIAEEVVMIHLLRYEQDLQRFRRCQQTVGLLCDNPLPFPLRSVAVPKRRPPTDQP